MFADLTHQLKALVPGLGIEVAVDATTVSQPLQPKPEAHQRSRGVLDGKELQRIWIRIARKNGWDDLLDDEDLAST